VLPMIQVWFVVEHDLGGANRTVDSVDATRVVDASISTLGCLN